MKNIKIWVLFSVLLAACSGPKEDEEFDFTTRFETSNGKETDTYERVIEFYQQLAEAYTSVAIYEMRKTDSGERLRLVTFNPDRSFESEFSRGRDKNVLLVNNGIHPGESDGIDASMMLIRDLAAGKIQAPGHTVIAVIPVYNIGGALNRNSNSRTNQNGPDEYGFRGNARNFDLNRDFIKCDTWNARSFAHLFRTVKPDLFIDNHVSNGADYQYTLTHLFTQHNKMGGDLGEYIHDSFMPRLEDSLQTKNWDITPYVNVFNRTPETGFSQFLDSPRYSTGYAALYNTLGMMVETHMLKPYKQRVEGTYELMKSFIAIADADYKNIRELREKRRESIKAGNYYALNWALDSARYSARKFKGYEASYVPSEITGANRLLYDRDAPYEREITYYDYFTATDSVKVPEKYYIPKGWWRVIDFLELNKIEVKTVRKDTTFTAEVYRIDSYETFQRPYEGHYPHYNTQIISSREKVSFKEFDRYVETNQEGVRFILETLEPAARDSFFNWNFFDTILQRKEGFSPYVWEDMALEFLNANPEIKAEFEAKKAAEPEFAANWYRQLDWIHKKSPYYEKSHLRYPIVRVGG